METKGKQTRKDIHNSVCLAWLSKSLLFNHGEGWPYILSGVEWSHLSVFSAEMTSICLCAQLPLFLNFLKMIQLFLFYVWTFCLYVFHMHALSEEGVCFRVSLAVMKQQDQSPRGGKGLSHPSQSPLRAA